MPKVIDVKNIEGNFFGGLPYNVNWDFGGGASPSKLTITVVNENGKYANPEQSLGFKQTSAVRIGNFNFNGYLVSYNLKKTPEQKTLELNYIDKSIDLDRYYIGLNETWGDKKNKGGKNLILVGKRYHPCDTDMDSTVEYKEKEGVPDPCDPCPEMPPNKYENACDEVITEFQIFPVYYTFNELIEKMPINCEFRESSKYKDFRADHIGTLKSVLGTWCSTLGLAYFWDPFSNTLKIISRSKKISVPSISEGDNIIDLEQGATVENTFARGTIGYLGRQGEIKEYGCEKSTLENLSCLTLGDLSADGKYNSGGGESAGGSGGSDVEKDYQAKQVAVALNYYNEAMRNAYIWFYYYGITDGLKAEAKINENKSAGSGASNKKMPPIKLTFYGNMEILDVYHAESKDETRKAVFTYLKSRLLNKEQKTFLNLELNGKGSEGTDDIPNYYFFVARMNEDLMQKEIDTEQRLAREFMGKYWYSEFKTTIPNTTNSKTEVSVEAPDGNGEWYYKNTQLKNLEIFKFGHEEGSFISTLDDNLLDSESEIEEAINKYIDDPKQKELLINGFILHQREGLWDPNSDKAKWFDTLFNWYDDQIPKKFSQSDGRPEALFKYFPEAKKDGSIKLFIARKGAPEAFKTKIENGVKHPNESPKRPIKKITEQDVFGDVSIKEICEYGLGQESKFTKITIGETGKNGSASIVINCPVGAFEDNDGGTRKQDSIANSESTDKLLYAKDEILKGAINGYDVIATAKANFSIYLPKLEIVKVYAPSTINVANVSYEYFDQLDNNLQAFRNNSSEFNRTNCMPDEKAVVKYMEKLNEYVKFSQESPTKRASFRMAGVFPQQYKIEEGLSSISISIDDNGVFTNYVLEDKIIEPPSIDVLSQKLKQNVPPLKSINDNKKAINKTNLKKYENAVRSVGGGSGG